MKTFALFLVFYVSHFIYQFFNMYVAKQSQTLTVFSKTYSNIWVFLIIVVLIFTPVLTIANLGFSFGFHYGYKLLTDIWFITIIFISAQLFSTITAALIIFGNNLEKGPIVGFVISLVGLAVANLWK